MAGAGPGAASLALALAVRGLLGAGAETIYQTRLEPDTSCWRLGLQDTLDESLCRTFAEDSLGLDTGTQYSVISGFNMGYYGCFYDAGLNAVIFSVDGDEGYESPAASSICIGSTTSTTTTTSATSSTTSTTTSTSSSTATTTSTSTSTSTSSTTTSVTSRWRTTTTTVTTSTSTTASTTTTTLTTSTSTTTSTTLTSSTSTTTTKTTTTSTTTSTTATTTTTTTSTPTSTSTTTSSKTTSTSSTTSTSTSATTSTSTTTSISSTTTTTTTDPQAPVMSLLVSALPTGAQELVVESEAGFVVGDTVLISHGGHSEARTIASFGSIVLDAPLAYAYPAGSTVLKQEHPPMSGGRSAQSASTLLVLGLLGGAGGAALCLCACRTWCGRRARRRRARGGKVAVFPEWHEVVPADCTAGGAAVHWSTAEAVQWAPGAAALRGAGAPGAWQPWPGDAAGGR
ncbi:unnamed protein product [Prorocentrum cordatum]|uniref:Uncharacterized protein n=1 Tax=Prorocentrum cordatum TaxID=2364126 RepID=A0ABN9R772_9DINO|nr:unnamed protein product [Polarella glacialis]